MPVRYNYNKTTIASNESLGQADPEIINFSHAQFNWAYNLFCSHLLRWHLNILAG